MNLLHKYKQWVRTNTNLIGAIEGALSSLTWLLPDRFSDSELRLEALNSLLGLLALYHESILQEPASAGDQKQPVPWPLWLGALQQVDLIGQGIMLLIISDSLMPTVILVEHMHCRWKCL